jgi:CubicO group peptidase (beta-lactamase class C family)
VPGPPVSAKGHVAPAAPPVPGAAVSAKGHVAPAAPPVPGPAVSAKGHVAPAAPPVPGAAVSAKGHVAPTTPTQGVRCANHPVADPAPLPDPDPVSVPDSFCVHDSVPVPESAPVPVPAQPSPPVSDNPSSYYPIRKVCELVDAAVDGGAVPGVVVSVGVGSVTVLTYAAGQADSIGGRAMTPDTVFDIASLSKVVATSTVVLALIGGGRLALDDAVADYLPGTAWPSSVTVRHLLTHTSGLPGSRKFYQWCATREELLRELYRTPPEASPGTRVTYSDLGFMALGELVAAVTGSSLDTAVRRLVTGPLGMDSTGYGPPGPAERFAATEVYDGSPLTGVVHDENARVMEGIAGHAGLFSTAADLARFAQWWVSADDQSVPVSLRQMATRCETVGLPGPEGYPGRRGLGWVCPGDRYDILGGHWPATSVSHTGFTGTSLALDPASGLWVVLLTNAVHFGRDAAAIRSLRRAVHAAAASRPTP